MLQINRFAVVSWVTLFVVYAGSGFAQEQKSLTTYDEVIVIGRKEKKKVLAPVEGTKIYSGKKTSVIDIEAAPAIVNSNYRQALEKTQGLL